MDYQRPPNQDNDTCLLAARIYVFEHRQDIEETLEGAACLDYRFKNEQALAKSYHSE